MKKVVINTCYGGFGLSEKASKLYKERSGSDVYEFDIKRDDPILIQIIEELGTTESSGRFAELKIVEIPQTIMYTIEEYDGNEWVAEYHRKWS